MSHLKSPKYQLQEIRLDNTLSVVDAYWKAGNNPVQQLQDIINDPNTKPSDKIMGLKTLISLVMVKPPTEAQLEVAPQAPSDPAENRARLKELLQKTDLSDYINKDNN